VFIRVEVGRLCREQFRRRPAEFLFLTRSFVAGGPVPQEGGGLGRARTAGSEGASPMKRHSVRGGDGGHGRAILLRFG